VPAAEFRAIRAERPRLDALSAGVAKHARKCGLSGVVRVCLLPQTADDEARHMPSIPRRAGLDASFSDLVKEIPLQRARLASGCSRASAAAQGSGRLPESGGTGCHLRVGLVFLDPFGEEDDAFSPCLDVVSADPALGAHAARHDEYPWPSTFLASGPPLPPLRDTLLTSPLTHESMERLAIDISTGAAAPHTPPLRSMRRVLEAASTMCVSGSYPRVAIHSAVFLLGIIFLCFDTLLCVWVGQMLSDVGWLPFAAWLLVPPLAPVLATCSGMVFFWLELPRLGRLHAWLVKASGCNLVVAALMWAIYLHCKFLVRELPVLCVFKLAWYLCLCIHINEMEMRHDMALVYQKPQSASFVVEGSSRSKSRRTHALRSSLHSVADIFQCQLRGQPKKSARPAPDTESGTALVPAGPTGSALSGRARSSASCGADDEEVQRRPGAAEVQRTASGHWQDRRRSDSEISSATSNFRGQASASPF